MEHLSRRTTHDIDYLLIISDPSPRGIITASRLRDLSKELDIKAKEIFLVLNRVSGEVDQRLLKKISDSNFDILGIINNDESLIDIELEGKTIFDLPGKSNAYAQVNKIIKKITL
jgi:CO dehydrogenase maturation factor